MDNFILVPITLIENVGGYGGLLDIILIGYGVKPDKRSFILKLVYKQRYFLYHNCNMIYKNVEFYI